MKKDDQFSRQMERILQATGSGTLHGLASLLGFPLSHISDAKRRGSIPTSWLTRLCRVENVDIRWILTGKTSGHVFAQNRHEHLAEYKNENEVLRKVSSRALAEELLRRISLARDKSLSPDGEN